MTIPIRSTLDARAAAMRGFNRFYMRKIGVAFDRLLDSDFSLAEVRVLYELAHRDGLTATALADLLAVDAGYLSRMLGQFEKKGLVARKAAADDARRLDLKLTARGRRAFAPLDRRAHDKVAAMLSPLPTGTQARLIAAMRDIETTLAGSDTGSGAASGTGPGTVAAQSPIVIRPPRAGDLGWVVQAHGSIYADEYGYDARFEALVAKIVADYVERFQAGSDNSWIADREGEPVGSVFIVRKTKTIAKLRLFIVHPSARGHGIGSQLLEECIRFSRRAGYRKIVLWTQSDLLAARALYKRAGFVRTASERHRSFGKRLVAETWELALSPR